RVEYAFDQEVIRLRDRLLPLVRLTEVLDRPRPFTAATREEIVARYRALAPSPPTPLPRGERGEQLVPSPLGGEGKGEGGGGSGGALFLAVVRGGAQGFGLIVDDVLRTEEIVVKPMHTAMKPLACFAGATILGDGRVALILSVEGIARHAGVAFDVAAEHAV